jgi:methylenetetrahydrofolate reductase (NADPH)
MKISIEFFPPRTPEVQQRLETCLTKFKKFNPEFYSVTFGAGGSTLEQTPQVVEFIKNHSKIPVAPHLTCIGSTKAEIRQLLDLYQANGVTRLVALRGDMPSGMQDPGELHYASDLVSFIREYLGEKIHISVGAYPEVHPQAPSPDKDLWHFKAKIDAGANDAITQYFFNFEAYEDFMNRALSLGIEAPIYPGIMAITNYKQLKRFSDSCGAEIPRWIDQRLAFYDSQNDKESIRQFGADVVAELCEKLQKAGAPGFHFYSLNRHEALLDIFQQLNW